MDLNEGTIIKILQNIEKRMAHIEEKLNTEQKNEKFHIEHIENLTLDNLSYHLETVDVKEVSGILNIGNTFREGRPTTIQKQKIRSKQTPKTEDISIFINEKKIPYKFVGSEENKVNERDPLSSIFTIGDIHIGTIEDASAVNFGNNFPTDFTSNKKHNQGFGNIYGNENDIHDIQSLMEEKGAVEVYYDSQEKPEDKWMEMLLKSKEEEN
ncbi:hypothetical protein [Metabacillus niabensis]|uniref:hypothetical protein n=1 Tax=Metabacillus niabensis TaxID=324854 RepID=UPI001CFA1E3B|nr:hypothetical protein [Metabacillus niabensis]